MANEKILVIDDAEVVCVSIKKQLEKKGYEVDIALSGSEAIEKAKSKKYNLVFIDLVIPEMDGIETCKKIKKLSPDIIAVMMTGKIDKHIPKEQAEFIKSGGKIYYLYKPFLPGEILNITKQALESRN